MIEGAVLKAQPHGFVSFILEIYADGMISNLASLDAMMLCSWPLEGLRTSIKRPSF